MAEPLCFTGIASLAAGIDRSVRSVNRARDRGEILNPDGKLGHKLYWVRTRVLRWLELGAPDAATFAEIERGQGKPRRATG